LIKEETYTQLSAIMGFETTIQCIRLETIQHSLKVKATDFIEGQLLRRILKKFNKLYAALSIIQCNELYEMLDTLRDYETMMVMQGLGGNEFMPLADLLKAYIPVKST
jgi:hypothetical protein